MSQHLLETQNLATTNCNANLCSNRRCNTDLLSNGHCNSQVTAPQGRLAKAMIATGLALQQLLQH
jgi:hypothetical protein